MSCFGYATFLCALKSRIVITHNHYATYGTAYIYIYILILCTTEKTAPTFSHLLIKMTDKNITTNLDNQATYYFCLLRFLLNDSSRNIRITVCFKKECLESKQYGWEAKYKK